MKLRHFKPPQQTIGIVEHKSFPPFRYGRLDSILNNQDGGRDDGDRCTWMNFGLWGQPQSSRIAFSAACAALARSVADAAGMPLRTAEAVRESCLAPGAHAVAERVGSSVLDLGCGCGDQLPLWAAEYDVRSISACTPEQRQVIAAASSYSHALVSCNNNFQFESALRRCSSCSVADGCQMRVECCDADSMLQRVHGTVFDFCVAVDSAYHFPRKRRLLHAVAGCLKDGGAFAFSDMLLQQVSASCRVF